MTDTKNPSPQSISMGLDRLARAFQAGFTGGNATWDETPEYHKEQFREGVRSLISDDTSRDRLREMLDLALSEPTNREAADEVRLILQEVSHDR